MAWSANRWDKNVHLNGGVYYTKGFGFVYAFP